MKSKKKQNIVRVLFLLALFFVGNYYLANSINSKVNREINSYALTNVDILGTSGHWNLLPFVIDDSATGVGAHNWTWAEAQPWCSGSGTLEEPYLIENVTIDGGNSGNCLTIKNSDKYFRIENCTVFNSGSVSNDAGIYLEHAGNGTLINNNCSFNNNFGMYITYSDNTTVTGNTANNNNYYGIILYYSDSATVSGNTANNNIFDGIYLYHSDNNTVSGNTANYNSNYGIRLYHSNSNTISGNTVDNNVNCGINVKSESDYNQIYKNYFTNNGIQARDSGNFNNWNSSIIGNYWDNYAGYDDDFDGIGDTPHNFGTGIDYLPIWTFQSPIHIDDSATGVGAHNWTWAETQPWCSGSGTFSDPYVIDGLNITARGVGSGILIGNSSKYFIVRNCKLIESGSGAYDAGIRLDYAGNGTLINNNCSFTNRIGIYLDYSDNNTVSGNTANNNQDLGIYLRYSDNTTVSVNTANNTKYGIYLSYSDNTTVSGNTANNNSWNGIALYYSDNTTVSGNTANNNNFNGIYLSDSNNNNTVSGNTANNNSHGIRLYHSNSNTISGNTVDNNVNFGIIVSSESDYNQIYKNYFINNRIHALDSGSYNDWNSSIIGNYWDDYAGYDDDFDGIGDTPHNFGTGIDYLPIWNFQSPIHIDDSPASPIDWAWAETQPWCSGSGTFSAPYVIDGLNITARGVGNGIMIENSYKYFIVRNCKVIESGSGTYDAGIRLDHAGNGTLINNNCSFNNNYGIYLDFSDNNTVSGNTANNNSNYGIYLHYSDNNTLSGNTAINNQGYGILLYASDNNTISGNTANNNSHDGIYLYESYNNTVSGNTASNNSFQGILIDNSDNNTVSGNTANNNSFYGICLFYSNSTTISGNTANNNYYHGIHLFYSNSTTISGNIVDNNGNYGIYTRESDYNLIYKNYFNDNNNINAYDSGTDNKWDNGTIGNYWDDYAGVDANDDGIGDTPYIISGTAGSQDNFPIWTDGDDIAPVITIILPSANSVFGLDAPNYQITIIELNLDTIWYSLDGGGTNYTITGLTGTFNQLAWEALSEGNFTIRFYANDTAENIGSAAVTVGKDISAPVITMILPIADSVFDLVAPNYNISIDDLNLDTIWYTLDGGGTNYTITGLTGTFNQLAWEALSEGSVTIRFYANDSAGNIGFTDVEVIIEIPEDLDGVPIISFGNYYILFTFIAILSFIILEKRKK